MSETLVLFQLALRAGNEKDEDQADTVGCCSLRVEHIKLHEKIDDKEFVVEFDFLGKDSIRYFNQVAVEKRAFKNLLLFTDNKQGSDDVFDRLNVSIKTVVERLTVTNGGRAINCERCRSNLFNWSTLMTIAPLINLSVNCIYHIFIFWLDIN